MCECLVENIETLWFPIYFPNIISLTLPVLTIRIARKAFSARTRRSSTMFFGSPSDFRGDFRMGCAPIAGLIHGKIMKINGSELGVTLLCCAIHVFS